MAAWGVEDDEQEATTVAARRTSAPRSHGGRFLRCRAPLAPTAATDSGLPGRWLGPEDGVLGTPVRGNEAVRDQPAFPDRHQSIPIATHVVEADLGEDGEVARHRGFGGCHRLEADVGDVVADDAAWRVRVLRPGGACRAPRVQSRTGPFGERRRAGEATWSRCRSKPATLLSQADKLAVRSYFCAFQGLHE